MITTLIGYIHINSPIHSFILDLGDITLEDIFTKKELLKLQEFGEIQLIHPLPDNINTELQKMNTMVRDM